LVVTFTPRADRAWAVIGETVALATVLWLIGRCNPAAVPLFSLSC
jgi:hypothetical protein